MSDPENTSANTASPGSGSGSVDGLRRGINPPSTLRRSSM